MVFVDHIKFVHDVVTTQDIETNLCKELEQMRKLHDFSPCPAHFI